MVDVAAGDGVAGLSLNASLGRRRQMVSTQEMDDWIDQCTVACALTEPDSEGICGASGIRQL